MVYFTRKNFLSLLLFFTVSFSAFAQAVVTLDEKKDACDATANGSIRVTVTSGVAPLSYFYLGLGFGQSGSGSLTVGTPVTITGLRADSYVFVVNDNDPNPNFNTIFSIGNITTPLAVAVDAAVNNSSCVTPNGSISITASGGSGSYSYSWSGPNGFTATTDDITGLVAGTYTATIFDNGTNCTRTVSQTITDPSPNVYAITTASPVVVCPSAGWSLTLGNSENGVTYTVFNNGGSTGITAAGNGSPLSFSIPSGSFVNGDIFTIRATNGFCTPQMMTGSVTVNIQNLAITVNSNTANKRCIAPFDGAVDISVTGTTNGITYAWTGPGGPFATQDIAAVQNGAYSVTATDNVTGCSITANVTVADARPTLALTNTTTPNTRCLTPFNGAINLTVSNSIGVPTFVWSSPNSFSSTLEDPGSLDDGPYVVTVTDPTSGCTATDNITVADGTPTLAISSAVTPNVKCVAPFTGSINLTVSNAMGTPTYAWSGPNSFSSTLEDPGSLDDGPYTVTVTDPASGCTATANITVTDGAPVLALTANVSNNTKCVAPSNGGIDLSVANGGPTYTYLWSGPGGFSATTQDIANRVSGPYSVTVTDTGSGCTATASYTINDTPLSVNVTPTIGENTRCLAPYNGSISLAVSGGGPAYTYIWSGPGGFNSTQQNITGLQQGDYTVTVTETATGCSTTLTNIHVNDNPPTLTITGSAVDNTRCVAPFNGSVDITVSGGSAYTYSWVSSVVGFTSTLEDISGLESGTYTVTVTETATGCTATEDFAVGNVTPTLALSSTSTDNTNCVAPFNGSIDLSVTGGTSYSYSWTRTSGGFTATTEDITGLQAGTYNVTVTDIPSGCTATLPATVVDNLPTISIGNSKTPNTRCVAPFNGSIDITIGGTAAGPFNYSWSGPGFSATTEDVANLRDGTYTVTVTDASTGCTASLPIVVNPSTPTLTLSRTITNNTRCVSPFNGAISITPGGTPGPFAFTYQWSNGATTQNISGLASGPYTVVVTDTNSGCTTTATYTVGNTPPTIGVAASITNNTHCAAPFDGAIDITLSGPATGPFTYSWSGPGGPYTTQDITAVQNGSYTVIITDTNTGCTATRTYNVGSSLPTITINQAVTPNTACATPFNGAIDITVNGGSGTYTYSWSDGGTFTATTQDISALKPGNYTVIVTDSNNGCTQTKTITVPNTPITFTATAAATTNTRCVSPFNGTVTLTITGGVGPFTYAWSTGATTKDLVDRPAGTYTVVITDQTTNCTATASATVADNLPVVSINSTPTPNTRCALPFNGKVDITVTGGTAPYNYSWTGPGFTSTSEDISALAPGDYTVVVTDPTSGCTRSTTVTVPNNVPTLSINGVLTANSRCALPFNGAIDITVTGGTAPYGYSWTSTTPFTSTLEDISGLQPGDYTVEVTDATSACVASRTFTILDAAPAIALSAALTHNTSCTAANGAIDLSVTPVSGTYDYTWSGPSFSATTQDIGNLAPGTYSVTVKDTNTGCTATASYTINNNVPTLAINLDNKVDNTRCITPFNGSISITVTGATGTLSYVWSGALGYSANTEDIANLRADTYTVLVTDAGSGCTATTSYTVDDDSSPLGITIDNVTHNTRCATPFNGAIAVTVSGSAGPFTYSWSTPTGFNANTEDLTALAPDNYTLVVTDNVTGCTATVSQPINDNAPVLTIDNIVVVDNSACASPFNGSISIDVNGGTGPYTYAWSTGATTEDITGLAGGTYDITVTETSTGCTGTATIAVADTPATFSATTAATDNTRCTAPYNGSIDLTVTGATGPFSYLWSRTGGGFSATTEDLANLQDGEYTVEITNQSTGCKITRTQIVDLAPPVVFAIAGAVTNNTKCVGPFDGAIALTITPVGTYTFLWTGPTPFTSTSKDISGLRPGTYTVEVTDGPTGCKQTASFVVNDAAPVIAVALDSNTPNTSCTVPFTGALSITATGGSGTYSYLWSGPGAFTSTNEDVTALQDGNYDVTVTDTNLGCTATQTFTVIDNKPVITLPTQTVVDNTQCKAPFNGSITVAAAGTPGPYTYTWTGTKGYTGSGASIIGLQPDDYTVTVTDGTNGCTRNFTITVDDDAPTLSITVDAKTANTQCQTPFDGSISITVGGSAGPFDYLWSGPNAFSATTEDLVGIEDGNYIITVTDPGTGCTGTQTIQVDDNKPVITVNADAITPNTACATPFNGAITVSASGTAGPYDYTWTGPNSYTGSGATIAALEPGDYTVTVKDQNLGCTATLLVTVPNNALSGIADAGAPTAGICAGATYTFTGASILNATSGTWTIVTQPAGGDGVLTPTGPMADPALATFTATVPGAYVIRLTANTGGGACAAGSDDITVNVSTGPTAPVFAGVDQLDACGPVQLAASSPAPGTGAWTATPGDGKFVPNATSRTAKFSGTPGVDYILRWTVTNGACVVFDEVEIKFNINSPSPADAGPDRRACSPNSAFMLAVDANTAAGEFGTWTITPATGTVIPANDPFAEVKGTPGAAYTLIWTITNPAAPAGCNISADTAIVRFDDKGPLADAGPSVTVCGSGQLNAKDPGTDDGLWTVGPGDVGIVIDDPASYKSTFSGPAGEYNLVWTVTNACGNSQSKTTVKIEDGPSPAIAGPDQTICVSPTQLAATPPAQGTGSWSQLPANPLGGSIVTPASATSDFSGTIGNTYGLVWTVTKAGCTPNTDTVFIRFTSPVPVNANAGPDSTVCGTGTNLQATLAAGEAGQWSIISANAGTGVIDPPGTDPNAHFQGVAGQTYVLRWAVTKGTGACVSTDADTVQITFNADPVQPEAGPDQLNVCGSATMAATPVTVGTGVWSYIALAPTTATGTFTPLNAVDSKFSGQAGASYRLYWTVTNGTCAPKKDSLTVSFDPNSPDVANAGPDQRICGIGPVQLAAVTPAANNTGTWTAIIPNDGSTIDPPLTNGASVFHPMAVTTYRLVWTVTNNLAPAGCGANRDTLVIQIDNGAPTVVDAGPDQTVCFATTNQVTLAGSDPGTNDGLWTVASGAGGTFANDTLRNTTFKGTSGTTYKLYWTISNGCGNVKDSVTIIFEAPPTTPVAGPDQLNLCGPAIMAANDVVVGTGEWSYRALLPATATGTFTPPNTKNSQFSGEPGALYRLYWKITNGTCGFLIDSLDVSFSPDSPTPANAGPDASYCGTAAVKLAANAAGTGETGTWTIIPNDGSTVAIDPADAIPNIATGLFTPVATGTYRLVWSIVNTTAPATCAVNADTVELSFDVTLPAAIDAGPDQTVCFNPTGSNAVTLAGDQPQTGAHGKWTIVTGTGGTFANDTLYNTTFLGTSGSTYKLYWTISNGCGSRKDSVTIKYETPPAAANAGPDLIRCTAVQVTMAATPATGTWSLVSGPAGPPTPVTSPVATFTGVVGQTYTFRWTTTPAAGSVCPATSDDIVVNYAAPPTVSAAPSTTICVNDAAPTLTAVAAGVTLFNWYTVDPTLPAPGLVFRATTGGSYTPAAELDRTVAGTLQYVVKAQYPCGESNGTAITITVSDTGGCGGPVNNCHAYDLPVVQHNPTCDGPGDGSLTFTVKHAVLPAPAGSIFVELYKKYLHPTVAVRQETVLEGGSVNFTGLDSATYIIRITDAKNVVCELTRVLQLETIVTATGSNFVDAICPGEATGQAKITATGGSSPYEYSINGTDWIPGLISGNVISGLPPNGKYNILVRDDNTDACPDTVSVTINSPAPITHAIANLTPVTDCNGADGAFTVSNIQGGSGTYNIRLLTQNATGGLTVVRDFEPVTGGSMEYTDLPQGSYIIVIEDGNGCTVNTSGAPTIIDAPGAIDFTVTKNGDATCTNGANSGSIKINFAASGSYLVGIGKSQTIEPARYQLVNFVVGDPPIDVDTLAAGRYFIFAKPATGTVCPSVRTITGGDGSGAIGGVIAVSFGTQRVCNTNGAAALNITNIKGDSTDVNATVTIKVFRDGDDVNPVEVITMPNLLNEKSLQLVYNPSGSPSHDFLTQPDKYYIELSQKQGTCTITTRNRKLYRVISSMTILVDNIRASLPEPRQTGGFTLKDIVGGFPSGSGSETPFYNVSIIDPEVDNVIVGPLQVPRNAQGVYEYDFANMAIGTYRIMVTDSSGCEADTLVTVPADTRIIIPNVFTPNNDDVNDTFEIVNLPVNGKHKLVVTNRWGSEVFTSSDYRVGTFWNAEGATEGIYFYRLKVEGGQTYTGWVEIIIGTKP